MCKIKPNKYHKESQERFKVILYIHNWVSEVCIAGWED
jgi:hypothetical protein